MPRVVVDTSVSLPATLSPTGMARKLWVLFAFGALNHQIEQHRIELDLLRIDAETIGAGRGGGWMAPLTGAPGRAAPIIRYVGTSITMSHARPAVRKHLIPLLWPDASAAQAAPAQGAA